MRGTLFAGQSSSTFDNPVQATVFFDAAAPVSGYTLDYRGNGELPAIGFGDFDVNDPGSYQFTQFRNRPQGSSNEFETFKGDLEYDFSDNITFFGGLSYKKYDFETSEVRISGNVADLPGFTGPASITADLAAQVTGYGSGLDGGQIDTSWLSANFDAAVALTDLLSVQGDASSRPQSNRSVTEEDTGAYAQMNFETQWGDLPVRGDIGARYVETKTTARGFVPGATGLALRVVDNSYEDFLPSIESGRRTNRPNPAPRPVWRKSWRAHR